MGLVRSIPGRSHSHEHGQVNPWHVSHHERKCFQDGTTTLTAEQKAREERMGGHGRVNPWHVSHLGLGQVNPWQWQVSHHQLGWVNPGLASGWVNPGHFTFSHHGLGWVNPDCTTTLTAEQKTREERMEVQGGWAW